MRSFGVNDCHGEAAGLRIDFQTGGVLASASRHPDMQKAALPPTPEATRADPAIERVRVPFIQRAALTLGGGRRDVFLVDLGLTGVFAEMEDVPAVGEPAGVSFRLPGNEIPITASCQVAWSHPRGSAPKAMPPGAGLRFVEIRESDRERLRDYLIEYCRRHTRARRFARHWPLPGEGGREP